MRHKLTKTENYLLVVSDEEIKKGDVVIENEINQIFNVQDININVGMLRSKVDTYVIDSCKKIIAHLPLNNSPIFEGVDLLPPLEDDVKVLAEQEYDRPFIVDIGINITPLFQEGFITGYNKAKETYKYTEEDMLKAFNTGYVNGIAIDEPIHFKDFIQSLQQPKLPIAFECEENIFFATNAFSSNITLASKGLQETLLRSPKTITNSEGRTEWVGKYIY